MPEFFQTPLSILGCYKLEYLESGVKQEGKILSSQDISAQNTSVAHLSQPAVTSTTRFKVIRQIDEVELITAVPAAEAFDGLKKSI